jgi:Ca2+-binding RTX toxin-like protein
VAIGGAGADTFLFVEGDDSIMLILDFERGVDRVVFQTTDTDLTAEALLDQLVQDGDDVSLSVNGQDITFEDALVDDFSTNDFLIA